MIVALASSDTITLTIGSVVVVLALVVFARLALRKNAPNWRRLRVGFFVERNGEEERK